MVSRSTSPAKSAANPARVDRWLWAVRIFKTRSMAATACRQGQVKVDEVVAKPARTLKVGEVIVVRFGPDTRTVVVQDFPAKRVGANKVADYLEDRALARPTRRDRVEQGEGAFVRLRGTGRPTKRERRLLDGIRGQS